MSDLSEFFDPISPDAPCGVDLEYDNARVLLNSEIQGTPEDQFSGQKYEPPNWREVCKQTQALLKKSKDLQLILYLVRSLIQLEGIIGFRDGLKLLDKSIVDYWDNIYPNLDPDDNDPTQRLNIIEELCNLELVLHPLSLSILFEARSIGRFNFRDLQLATDKLPLPAGATKPDLNMIKAAIQEADVDSLQQTYQAICECGDFLKTIETSVGEKVSGLGNGVNFSAINALIKDIRFNFEELTLERLSIVDDDKPADLEDITEGQPATNNKSKSAAHGIGEICTRQDVVKTLDLLCKYYVEYEPSSPVPLLLQRAKVLATANFTDIVKNLMPDAIHQINLIKGPDPDVN